MDKNYRYSILVFPQKVEDNRLHFNIVFLPRNRDPFLPTQTGVLATPSAISFADLIPQFEAKIVPGLEELPVDNGNPTLPLTKTITVDTATKKAALLQAIGTSFGGQINNTGADKAEAPKPVSQTVRKYLPLSYRNAFNFTGPRHKNAVTDDSYHCAMRDATPNINPKTVDKLSWGKVFGYIMRQPLLAKACGFVYSSSVELEPAWFEKGGYLFVDLANADHVAIQNNSWTIPEDGAFVKRFAARIPKLKAGENRTLFAPVLFPVLHSFGGVVTEPKAPWDAIFKEMNAYDDGFAKVVHSNQPVSLNLLAEQYDGAHPVHEAGIRLGWDDEQILIWYVRQMAENPDDAGKRVETPLGVFGYRIDARKSIADPWQSLNTVVTKEDYKIGDVSIGNAVGSPLELPYQVYPSQVDGQAGNSFWLPMYYTNWIGKGLVLKDDTAARIYQHEQANMPVSSEQIFQEKLVDFKLIYGNTYYFRVRLCDLSNGGPGVQDEISAERYAANPAEKVDFKRYIRPGKLRFLNLQNLLGTTANPTANHIDFYNQSFSGGVEQYDANPVINLKRPVLGYPAVLFTGKYQDNDAIAKLTAIAAADADPNNANATRQGLGIADPDVTKVEVIVEVETLQMDNSLSYSGTDNFARLYSTYRNFNAADFEAELNLPFSFVDAPVLNLVGFDYNNIDPFNDPSLGIAALNSRADIVLPTARKVRITLRAVCEEDDVYFGSITGPSEQQTRYGATTQMFMYKESVNEAQLLQPWDTIPVLQGIFLQPDAPFIKLGGTGDLFARFGTSDKPNIVQRLARQIDVESKGLTLTSKKGQRIIFGCSNRIRHSLAPDQSSITFASKEDLTQHWLGCIVYKLNRDWSWDGLDDVAFSFERTKKFRNDTTNPAETQLYLGDIEIKKAASFEALQQDRFGLVNRNETMIVFIDAIDPKTVFKQANGELRFPDELQIEYKIKAKFKTGHGNNPALLQPDLLSLPTTVNPAQVPKLASVGLAFSPYIVNGNYESTDVRQRYLWIELTEPIKDPSDTLFCRMLAYAPDQLISNNDLSLLEAPEDPPLPIDTEYVRAITPNQSDDLAGYGAMQVLTKATDSDIHYLMPLPPGMHSESPELFGFFTYEFRVGHGHWADRDNNLWSTAQGRFGRALRVTGMQHPAPSLRCVVNRDEKQLYVNAQYAQAVHRGKNVTASPPRTQLWCILYAQVHQADGKAFRNILLDDRYMDWRKKLYADAIAEREMKTVFKRFTRREEEFTVTEMPKRPSLDLKNAAVQQQLAAGAALAIFKDQPRVGTAAWTNKEVGDLLRNYGLPVDSPLSVLTVEVFGNITNIREHLTNLFQDSHRKNLVTMTAKDQGEKFAYNLAQTAERAGAAQEKAFAENTVNLKPLSSGLGHYRILRSSPLTKVPFVCCTDC